MITTAPVILYPKGTVRLVAQRFGVSEPTVRSAFRFATESELAERIRRMAVKEYGCKESRRIINL